MIRKSWKTKNYIKYYIKYYIILRAGAMTNLSLTTQPKRFSTDVESLLSFVTGVGTLTVLPDEQYSTQSYIDEK